MFRSIAWAPILLISCGCSSLLPNSELTTASSWQSYADAQQAFDQIIPGKTTAIELRHLRLDPQSNPNIVILNYADVLRRFMVSQSLSVDDLDHGVRECVQAKTLCHGYEVDQRLVNKQRKGNFFLDLLGFRRETHTAGWRFNGLVLVKEGVVIYKLTGGQPTIAETEHSNTPLGPVQSVAGKFLGGWSPSAN